jgi:ribosomal 50S subunit-recycling heat shock protein
MRLDLFLKKTCVISQRSVAKQICDAGAARINGAVAKASHDVEAGDRIHLEFAQRDLEIEVVDVPFGNVAKRDAGRYVTVVRDVRRAPPADDY